MSDNLTYDDSLLESHYSKTCEASSYKEELSATSKPDSQINTTEELSKCLARLNANRRKVGAGDGNTYVVGSNRPDAIALANKLHAENERLKALLVATRGIFKEAVDCVDNCCDCLGCSSDETLRPRVSDALAKLHAAGTGGE